MNIGIFDSGVGGLIVAHAIRKMLPRYDYVYLGDTKRVPYGNRSSQTVYQFTKEGVEYLFKKEHCAVVVLACNTASAEALRKIQEEYLPKNWQGRKVIGVIIPTAEEAAKWSRVGVLATAGTVASGTLPTEIKKVNKNAYIIQNPAPLLVPLAEAGEGKLALPFIKKYLAPLLEKKVEAIVLGCTHYPIFKKEIRKMAGRKIKIISQDEIVPKKFKNYLIRHPEIEKSIGKNGKVKILITDETARIDHLTRAWFGKVKPTLIKL